MWVVIIAFTVWAFEIEIVREVCKEYEADCKVECVGKSGLAEFVMDTGRLCRKDGGNEVLQCVETVGKLIQMSATEILPCVKEGDRYFVMDFAIALQNEAECIVFYAVNEYVGLFREKGEKGTEEWSEVKKKNTIFNAKCSHRSFNLGKLLFESIVEFESTEKTTEIFRVLTIFFYGQPKLFPKQGRKIPENTNFNSESFEENYENNEEYAGNYLGPLIYLKKLITDSNLIYCCVTRILENLIPIVKMLLPIKDIQYVKDIYEKLIFSKKMYAKSECPMYLNLIIDSAIFAATANQKFARKSVQAIISFVIYWLNSVESSDKTFWKDYFGETWNSMKSGFEKFSEQTTDYFKENNKKERDSDADAEPLTGQNESADLDKTSSWSDYFGSTWESVKSGLEEGAKQSERVFKEYNKKESDSDSERQSESADPDKNRNSWSDYFGSTWESVKSGLEEGAKQTGGVIEGVKKSIAETTGFGGETAKKDDPNGNIDFWGENIGGKWFWRENKERFE